MNIEFKVAGKSFKTQNEANEYLDKVNNTKIAYVVIKRTPALNEYDEWKMTEVDITPLSYYDGENKSLKESYFLPDVFLKFANMVWNKHYPKYGKLDNNGALVENYSRACVHFYELDKVKQIYAGCKFNVRKEFDLSNLSYDYDKTFKAIEFHYLAEPDTFPSPFID
jgi:hypothetical protein